MVYHYDKLIELGDKLVAPFNKDNVSASSVDLTLADDFIDNIRKGGR